MEENLKFVIELGSQKIKVDLNKELEVETDPNEIANKLREHPARYAYWSVLAEKATLIEEKLKNDFESWYAEKFEKTKDKLIEEHGKSAVTSTFIKNKVISDYKDEYHKKIDELMKATFRKRMLVLAQKSIDKLGDSLINLLSYCKVELQKLNE